MPNDMMRDLAFNEQIKDFTPEGRFLAHQIYEVHEKIGDHSKRLDILESSNKKAFGITSGLSAVLGGAIIAAINYFAQR